MDLEWRVVVLVAALAAGGIAWWLVQRGRGTFRQVSARTTLPTAVAHRAGEQVTVVQVSSEHCAACVRGARIWRNAVAERAGAVFLEIDADDHMDLVRELGIMTTPTSLVYDAAGALRSRVTGAPTPKAAADALDPVPAGVLA